MGPERQNFVLAFKVPDVFRRPGNSKIGRNRVRNKQETLSEFRSVCGSDSISMSVDLGVPKQVPKQTKSYRERGQKTRRIFGPLRAPTVFHNSIPHPSDEGLF